MTDALSLEQWYTQGSFAPFVRERRLVASTPVWMFDVCQPAGDFPDPPIEEMVLIQDKRHARTVCDLGAGRFRHEPGGVVVVPRLAATQFTVSNAHHIRVLGFSPRTLDSWTELSGEMDFGHLHASSLKSTFMHQLMDRIWDAGSLDGDATTLYSDAALLTLWAELVREARRPLPIVAKGGLAPWQIRRCTDFLIEHASESVGLDQLASLAGLSPFHFARAFKHSTGVPPHRFQLRARVEKAMALLQLTDLAVTQIALEVGYDSSQALTRLFRREVGSSPSEYRRLHRL